MKFFVGLAFGLVLCMSVFAGQKQDCEDLKAFLSSKGKKADWVKDIPETACVDLADLFFECSEKRLEAGLIGKSCAEALIQKEDEVKQYTMRLTECNRRNGWKY